MDEQLYLDDVTGTLGEWLEMDTSEIPVEAINLLQGAYNICVKSFEEETKMKTYRYNVCFGDGRWAGGTINIEASSEKDAESKVCEYIGTHLYQAFPELDIEYTWELYDIIEEGK